MTNDELMAWVMHRFSDVFRERAIIKGGMALRLLDSPRFTNDIDYVFVRYDSKKAVAAKIREVLGELEGARIKMDVHSKMIRADIRFDGAAIQIEANVAVDCPSVPMATGEFARSVGQPSRVVRIMAPDVALAHKIAAWNERRIARDLYDVYFLSARAGAKPDQGVLSSRLARFESRLPKLRKKKSMSFEELVAALSLARDTIDDELVEDELGPLVSVEERAGLALRIKAALAGVIEGLSSGLAGD